MGWLWCLAAGGPGRRGGGDRAGGGFGAGRGRGGGEYHQDEPHTGVGWPEHGGGGAAGRRECEPATRGGEARAVLPARPAVAAAVHHRGQRGHYGRGAALP